MLTQKYPDLPLINYTNFHVDFSPVHAMCDKELPLFEKRLGKAIPNIIGGRKDNDGKKYRITSPIDHSIHIGTAVAASAKATDRAIIRAKKAFESWSKWAWKDRILLFRRIADEFDRRKYEHGFATLYEVGKHRLEALGETSEASVFIRYYCDVLEANHGYTRSMNRAYANEDARSIMKPYGVFACISPFNFPIAMAINMITGAVLTGNTLIFKPTPEAALTASMLVEAMQAAGLPDGVVNLLNGGDDVGKRIIKDPRIDGAVFTGSHKVGMEIFRTMSSGPYVRPTIVEMGGKNPTYVTASANLDDAALGIMRSAFGMSGQKCSANSKIYVEKKVANDFLKRLVALTEQYHVGDVRLDKAATGPVINNETGKRYHQAIKEATKDGRVLFGGCEQKGGIFDKGCYLQPTIITNLPANHRLHKEELFAPITCVQTFTSLDKAIDDGNAVLYGLTAGCYAQDRDEIELFKEKSEAGVKYINRTSGATTGTWPGTQTFCGWKGTGVTGKGAFGPYYLTQFMREQSHTEWFGTSVS